jgi:hypothetical protein
MGGVERGGLKASAFGGRLLCLRGEQEQKQIPPAPLLQRGEAIGGVRRLGDGAVAFVDAVIAASKTFRISKTFQAPTMFQMSKVLQRSEMFQTSKVLQISKVLQTSEMFQTAKLLQTSKMVQTSNQFQASRMLRPFRLLQISPTPSALQTRRVPPSKPVLFPPLQKGGRGDSLLPLLLPLPSAPPPNPHRPRGTHP